MYPITQRVLIHCYLHHPHARLSIAADAPADAKSCLALTLLVTRGRPLFPDARAGPVLTRLFMLEEVAPVILDTRRAEAEGGPVVAPVPDILGTILTGLDAEGVLVGILVTVEGGSGRGLLLIEGAADGTEKVLCRLTGDSFLAAILIGAMEDFWPVRNSCLTASSGFIRRSGSQRKQRARKSRKTSSSHLMAC
jgi:hypothetical protein